MEWIVSGLRSVYYAKSASESLDQRWHLSVDFEHWLVGLFVVGERTQSDTITGVRRENWLEFGQNQKRPSSQIVSTLSKLCSCFTHSTLILRLSSHPSRHCPSLVVLAHTSFRPVGSSFQHKTAFFYKHFTGLFSKCWGKVYVFYDAKHDDVFRILFYTLEVGKMTQYSQFAFFVVLKQNFDFLNVLIIVRKNPCSNA